MKVEIEVEMKRKESWGSDLSPAPLTQQTGERFFFTFGSWLVPALPCHSSLLVLLQSFLHAVRTNCKLFLCAARAKCNFFAVCADKMRKKTSRCRRKIQTNSSCCTQIFVQHANVFFALHAHNAKFFFELRAQRYQEALPVGLKAFRASLSIAVSRTTYGTLSFGLTS